MTSPLGLSFVLISQNVYPDPRLLIESAAGLGVGLTHEPAQGESMVFNIDTGGSLLIGLMPAPHPDAAGMMVGPTSPEPSVIEGHVGHFIVTAFGVPEGPRDLEVLTSMLTTAVIRSTPAVAAMLSGGVIFHRADVFAGMVEASGDEIATAVTVDITAAQEAEDRMSFLTHGLHKYDREEFYVTASVTGDGALDYLMALVQWMVTDREKVLATGDTVGRTVDEKILVQRVPSPIEDNPDVIRLDMDTDVAQPKKRGWFRKG